MFKYCRIQFRRAILLTLASPLLACALQNAQPAPQDAHPATGKPDIYDRKADGFKQIETALAVAKRENKRVLLQFGANWCPWCHKLHDLFKSNKDIARTLLYEYEVVLIDVDTVDGKVHNADVNAKYGNPMQKGLPVIVVLDASGSPLTTQDTAALEDGDHHDPAKVAEFLGKWKAAPQNADDVLKSALAAAKTGSKKVFLYFSAPWCPWCHKMSDWLARPEVAALMGKAYVPVMIDRDRMTGGGEMDAKFQGTQNGGIPFFVVLDADGKKLADGVGDDGKGGKGNVGFPVEPHEVGHLISVLKQTGPQLTDADLKALESSLAKKPS
ncbi:MAG: thioredoxin family protein [Phycisphaerales bacterium]|nr:thioredoxin family protein [Phycisphaerales bacterium]